MTETFDSLAIDLDIPELKGLEGKVSLDTFSTMSVDQMATLGIDRQSHLKVRRYYITKENKAKRQSQNSQIVRVPVFATPKIVASPKSSTRVESLPSESLPSQPEENGDSTMREKVNGLIALNRELLQQNRKLVSQIASLKADIDGLKSSVPSLTKLVQNQKQTINKISDEMAAMKL